MKMRMSLTQGVYIGVAAKNDKLRKNRDLSFLNCQLNICYLCQRHSHFHFSFLFSFSFTFSFAFSFAFFIWNPHYTHYCQVVNVTHFLRKIWLLYICFTICFNCKTHCVLVYFHISVKHFQSVLKVSFSLF